MLKPPVFPTQTYKPKHFEIAVAEIYNSTIKVVENGRNVYYDASNNRYVIDGADGTITVN